MSYFALDHLKDITAYQAGEQPTGKKTIKLNSNENPYPIPATLSKKIEKRLLSKNYLSQLKKYPSITKSELLQEIAKSFALSTEQIICGNGSDEIITNIFRCFIGSFKKLLLTEYTYSSYFSSAAQNNSLVSIFSMPDFQIKLDQLSKYNFDVFFLVNPNAPTGGLLEKINIIKAVRKYSKKLFIIDEAYIDFCEFGQNASLIDEVKNFSNLIVLRTLSKGYSLAGIRLGYAVAQKEIIDALKKVTDPYNINSFTHDIGTLVFKKISLFKKNISSIIATKKNFSASLKKIGFETMPSETNFIFTKPPKINEGNNQWINEGNKENKRSHEQKQLDNITTKTDPRTTVAYDLFDYLKKKQVYVRYFNQEKLKHYLRITIGTKEQMEQALALIKEFYQRNSTQKNFL